MSDTSFPDDPPGDPDPPPRSGLLPESIKKALVSGLSAVAMTEEGIRSALSDMRLPKEAISYVVQQTEKSRRELFQTISHEIKGFLRGIDFPGELRKALTGMKLEVRADVRFVQDGATQTEVHSRVRSVDEPATRRKRRRT